MGTNSAAPGAGEAERARKEFTADAYFAKLSQFYGKVLSA